MSNKIGFIGAGNMATAIIKGLHHSKMDCEVFVCDIDYNKALVLKEYSATAVKTAAEVVSQVDYLILAVKPQMFEEVLLEIKPDVNKNAVIISIAAGIGAQYIKSSLGFDAKVVLVMPNTPLLVNEGATALSNVSPTSQDEFDFICSIFEKMGEIAVVANDKMNEIIPINGSSPAFIYQITKHFVDYATGVGIDEKTALKLFCASLQGTAKMMMTSGYDLDTLIEMVSSKGGTTIAGLKSFENDNLSQVIKSACQNCANRAFELSK